METVSSCIFDGTPSGAENGEDSRDGWHSEPYSGGAAESIGDTVQCVRPEPNPAGSTRSGRVG